MAPNKGARCQVLFVAINPFIFPHSDSKIFSRLRIPRRRPKSQQLSRSSFPLSRFELSLCDQVFTLEPYCSILLAGLRRSAPERKSNTASLSAFPPYSGPRISSSHQIRSNVHMLTIAQPTQGPTGTWLRRVLRTMRHVWSRLSV